MFKKETTVCQCNARPVDPVTPTHVEIDRHAKKGACEYACCLIKGRREHVAIPLANSVHITNVCEKNVAMNGPRESRDSRGNNAPRLRPTLAVA